MTITITAINEDNAIAQIQEMHPDFFVYAWDYGTGWDVAVYRNEKNFDLDAGENCNDRMEYRYQVHMKVEDA